MGWTMVCFADQNFRLKWKRGFRFCRSSTVVQVRKMSFSRGGNTLQVSVELFLENRRRLIEATRAAAPPSSVIVLRGGVEKGRYNTDADDLPLRQESYFFWAFGIHESDCYVAIDVDSGRSVLFPPKLAPDYAIWLGKWVVFEPGERVCELFLAELSRKVGSRTGTNLTRCISTRRTWLRLVSRSSRRNNYYFW